MYKIQIINEVNGRSFGAKFADKDEKNAWIDKQIAKNSWGLSERRILRQDVPAELESRIIKTELITQIETNEQGEEVEVSVEYATVKPDYVITETNLNLSKTYRNQKKREARKAEYKSIEEVMHIILDHGLDSQEFQDLQNERAAIKAKYPLES